LLAEVANKDAGETLECSYEEAYGEKLAEAVHTTHFDHWVLFRQLLPSAAQAPLLGDASAGNAAALHDAVLWGDQAAVVSLVLPAPSVDNTRTVVSDLAHTYYDTYGYTIAEHLQGRFPPTQQPALMDGDDPGGLAVFGPVSALKDAIDTATADSPAGDGATARLVRGLEKLLVEGTPGADSKPAVAAILRQAQQLEPSARHDLGALYEKRHGRTLLMECARAGATVAASPAYYLRKQRGSDPTAREAGATRTHPLLDGHRLGAALCLLATGAAAVGTAGV
jgi:hypothetical protein